MLAPPPAGDPYLGLADNQPNPGSVGAVEAWDQWKLFASTVLDQSIADLRALPFVTA